MGKLTNLRPRLGSLGAALTTLDVVRRDERVDWRRWYGTTRWKQLRRVVFERDGYVCRMCGLMTQPGHPLRMPIADHRQPHRGDERLFFDPLNVETLHKSPCHDRHKQRLEQGL